MVDSTRTYPRNRLLASLPANELARLEPNLRPVDLALGQVVYESGCEQTYMYFPLDSIVCRMYMLEDGRTGEMAIIGNDGMIGVTTVMGASRSPHRAVVQCAGSALRIWADIVLEEFKRGGALQRLLLRYVQAMVTQMSQTAVCNRHHLLEQQLCRWLLMMLDRLPGNELFMTQELMGDMLGVRREGVTEAAGRLQKAGVISYRRGRIQVLDRERLEQMSCECYRVVRDEIDRLLPWKVGAETLERCK